MLGALGKLNMVAGVTRPEMSCLVCDQKTKVKTATINWKNACFQKIFWKNWKVIYFWAK